MTYIYRVLLCTVLSHTEFRFQKLEFKKVRNHDKIIILRHKISTETLRPAVTEEATELLLLVSDDIAGMRNHLPAVQDDFNRLRGHLNTFRKNCRDEFATIDRKYPELSKLIESLSALFASMEKADKDSKQQLIQGINEYNKFARQVNSLLDQIRRENREGRERQAISALHEELSIEKIDLSDVEKEDLRSFAEQLWKEFFPESNVDKFTKWASGQEKLAGYQKVLIAPANGVEDVVMGMVNAFRSKTYEELAASVETMYGLSYEDWCDLWRGIKFTYEQLPTTDKTAAVISFIASVAFLAGGIQKVIRLAQKMGLSAKVIGAIKAANVAKGGETGHDQVRKVVPLEAMLGSSLPYIKPEKKEKSEGVGDKSISDIDSRLKRLKRSPA